MSIFGPPNVARLEEARNVSALVKALEFRDVTVRRRAADALGRIGTTEAVSALVAALHRAGPDDVKAAVIALGRSGTTRVVAELIIALQDARPGVSGAAVESIIGIGAQAVPPLIEAISDRSFGARAAAAEALGWSTDQRPVPALTAALKDREPEVRRAAGAALRRLGVSPVIPTFSGPLAARLNRRIAGFRDSDEPGTSYLDFLDQQCDDEVKGRFEEHQAELHTVLAKRTKALSNFLMPRVEPEEVMDFGRGEWSTSFALGGILQSSDTLGSLAGVMVWRHKGSYLHIVSGPRLVRTCEEAGARNLLVVIATKTIDNSDYVKMSYSNPRAILGLLGSDKDKRERQESFEVEFLTTPQGFDPANGIEGLTMEELTLVPWYSSVAWPNSRTRSTMGGIHNMEVEKIAGAVDMILEDECTPVPQRAEAVPEWRPWRTEWVPYHTRKALEREAAAKQIRASNVPLP